MKKLFTRLLSIGFSAAMMTTVLAVNSAAESNSSLVYETDYKADKDKIFTNFNVESGRAMYLKGGVDFDLKYFADVDGNTKVTASNRFLKINKNGDSIVMTGLFNIKTENGKEIPYTTKSDLTIENGTDSILVHINTSYITHPSSYLKLRISSSDIYAGELFTITGENDYDNDYLIWTATNDNIKYMSGDVLAPNEPVQFKAVRPGKTTIYCMTASGIVKSIDLNIGSAANASTDKLEAAHEPVVKTQYNDGNTSVWFKAPPGTTLRCTYDGTTPTAKTAVYNGTKFKFSTEKTFKVRVEREGYKPAVYTYTKSVIGNSFETLEKIHSRVSYLTDYTKHPAYIALTASEKKLADDIISGERSKLIDQLYIKAIEECEILSDEEYYEKITLPLKRHYGFLTDEERNNAFTATRLIETSKNAAKSIDELFEPYLKNIGLKNSELKSAKALAKSIVEKALKKTTPYEQIKSLHDSLCEITQYDYDLYEVIIGEMARKEYNKKHPGTNHILVNGLGVCADYTDVFNLLCNAAGYEAVYTGGSTDGEPHAWSAVRLEGTWYYVDTTWDDNEDHCGYTYFLKGYDTFIRGSRRAENNYIDSIVSRTDYKK